MNIIKKCFALLFIFFVTSCSQFKTPLFENNLPSSAGSTITSIIIDKTPRKLFLMAETEIFKSYKIGLGASPVGKKTRQGDGKTPEGLYFIDRKNPKSKYYLSLGISYPNKNDISAAKAQGHAPGGNIFIHGQDNKPHFFKRDWTSGCVSMKNKDIAEIYRLVSIGTPVLINP